ncbi:MAG TPA: exopolysaccharide biosynthesis polyprenyl glycosylphosphotransferase, partial [Usitatibacter sp.]|nr:exopolysaccharide biosynthesis polyprenyl glycosylphosphotransferase [Usitatibacter sp.]
MLVTTSRNAQRRPLGLIRPYSSIVLDLSRAFDAALIVATAWAVTVWSGHAWGVVQLAIAAAGALVFVLVGDVHDVYRSWRSESLLRELSRVAWSWCVTAALVVFGVFLLEPPLEVHHDLALLWFTGGLGALGAGKAVVRQALHFGRTHGRNFRRTAVVGSTPLGALIAREIGGAPWMGLKFVGFYDDREALPERVEAHEPSEIRGRLDDLVRAARDGDVDRVYITLPMRAELRIRDIIERLSDLPVEVLYAPDFFMFNLLHAQWEQVGPVNVVNAVNTPFLGVSGLAKRAEDLVLGTLILAVIAVPLAAIAIAVKLTSPGPVLFRQRRYGLNGAQFEIWKFRTMTVMEDGDAFVQARAGDARVTPLGRFLRRTSLDELPQFINVLRGDMSIVGPRPHPVALDEQHRRLIPHYFSRHKIRP